MISFILISKDKTRKYMSWPVFIIKVYIYIYTYVFFVFILGGGRVYVYVVCDRMWHVIPLFYF